MINICIHQPIHLSLIHSVVLAVEDFSQAEDLIKKSIYEALEELSQNGLPREYTERTETSTDSAKTTE